MTLRPRFSPVLVCLFALTLGASSAVAATRVVDDDGEATPANCNSSTDTPYTTITEAIDDAVAGDKIIVCPGVYAEQIEITKALTITGVRGATVKPNPAVANTSSLFSGAPIAAIVLVDGATNVIIDQLTIDGSTSGLSGCGTNFVGIFYRNGSGTVKNAAVKNIYLGAGSEGCQAGLGIFAQSGDSGSSSLTVIGTSVHDYQKNGITANEPGTTLTATNNFVTGWGPTTHLAQNGIQIGFGATGTLKGNRVIDNIWSPCATPDDPDCAAGSASGIIIFDAADTTVVTANTVGSSQTGVYFQANAGSVTGNLIQNTQTFDGVAVVGDSNQVLNNSIFDSDEAGVFLFGESNIVQKNTINEAPVGIFIGSGTNVVPTTGKTKNVFFNVPVPVETAAAITVSSTPTRTTTQPAR